MELKLVGINTNSKQQVLNLFKDAAEKISKKNIDHWQYWKNPPNEKVEWVEEGILKKEFFFVKNNSNQLLGMVRILNEDLLYWGKQEEKALYIHSLVVIENFEGKGVGKKIIQKIEKDAKINNCKYLRLDSDANNPRLCKYYENQGFKKVGEKILPISTYNLYEKIII